MLNYTKSTNIS